MPLQSALPSGAFPRFGSNVNQAVQDLGPITRGAHHIYQLLAGDPGRRIIFMDLVGWCGMRTVIDYNRELFYAKDKQAANTDKKTKGNGPAALERVLREITATASDVAVAGPLVAHLSNLYDKRKQQFTGNFIDQQFMQYCEQTARNLTKTMGKGKPLQPDELMHALFQKIAADMGKGHSEKVQTQLKQWFTPKQFDAYLTPETRGLVKGLKNVFGGTTTNLDGMHAEVALAKIMNTIGDHGTGVANAGNYANLLSNMHKLRDKMLTHFAKEGISLEAFANKLKHSRGLLSKAPLLLFAIFGINLVMPRLIQKNTQRVYGMSSYPGEAGLLNDEGLTIQAQASKKPTEDATTPFPFLSNSLKKGNVLPLLGAALMLPAALGIYRSGMGLKGMALPKGLSPKALKQYGKEWLEAHAFSTSFPWASDQQQATTYANTLLSRIATARSPIEFRERLIDSLMSYGVAFEMNAVTDNKIAHFLANGKKGLSKTIQKALGVNKADLFKPDGSMRDLQEIYSLPDAKVRRDTLAIKTWQGWMATLLTTLTMGVIEPIASIFLTSKQAAYMNQKARKKRMEQAVAAYGQQTKLTPDQPVFSAFAQTLG
jgi:hypothetical protein